VEGNDYEFQVLEGLEEGENIVVSGQFMLDSESRLREAIQKMLAVKTASDNKENTSTEKGDDMDMSNISMEEEDDLDMEGMTMDDPPSKP